MQTLVVIKLSAVDSRRHLEPTKRGQWHGHMEGGNGVVVVAIVGYGPNALFEAILEISSKPLGKWAGEGWGVERNG